MNRTLFASLLLVPCAALAGPYDQPYALITVDTAKSPDIHLRRVIVNRVDGETILDNRAVVEPGKRQVTLDLPARKGFKTATQNTFEIDARPCTRYFVAARLDNTLGQQWKPVIRSEEPIGECRSKFKIAEAK